MRRATWLLVAGLVSELVYLAVTLRLSWWQHGSRLQSWSQLLSQPGAGLGGKWGAFAACLAGLVVLMAAYVVGWLQLRTEGGLASERRIVWGFAVLYAATLIWLLPITSDIFTYLTQAHQFTDLRANPLQASVLDSTGDGDPAAPSVDPLITAFSTRYARYPSVYGPAWTLLSAPGTLGAHDIAGGLLYLKGLCAVAFLGCAWLLEQILRQVRPAATHQALYLFAWNPLVLLMAVGDGHNDAVMMAAVLLAFWLLLRSSSVLAFSALAVSMWIKYVGVIFFPLFLLHLGYAKHPGRQPDQDPLRLTDGRWSRGPWPAMTGAAVSVVLVSALVLAPFGSGRWFGGMLRRFLHPVNWRASAGGLSTWVLLLGLLAFLLAYLFVVWRLVQQLRGTSAAVGTQDAAAQPLLNASFSVAMLAFVLGAGRSQPWHLIWPAALAGLSTRRWAWPVVAVLSALMLAGELWIEWGTPGL